MTLATYLDEPTRISAAISYVDHELKKLRTSDPKTSSEAIQKVSRRTTDLLANQLKRALESTIDRSALLRSLSNEELWRLFHVISFGLEEKELWNCLGHPLSFGSLERQTQTSA